MLPTKSVPVRESQPIMRHVWARTSLELKKALTYTNGRLFGAEVVELADALRSGRSGRKPVWVQIPPSAPVRECRNQADGHV